MKSRRDRGVCEFLAGSLATAAIVAPYPAVFAQTSNVPTPAAAPPTGQPFAMRGVPLGITLGEFRAAPIPSDHGQTNLRSHCTNEEPIRSGFISEVDPDDKRDGVITCNWFGTSSSGLFDSNLYIALGDGAGSPAFDFIDDGGVERLFRIRFYANSDYSAAIRRGLTDRYGAPVVTTDKVRTGAGIEFDASALTWANAASSITFESPCRRIDRYCLTYRHTGLMKLYDAMLAKRATAAAKRF